MSRYPAATHARTQVPLPPAASLDAGAAAPTVCVTADLALSDTLAAARHNGKGILVLLHAAAGRFAVFEVSLICNNYRI